MPDSPNRQAETITWWRVATRPRWIGALVLSLAVAAAFGLLGQWQIERAFVSQHALIPVAQPVVSVEQVMAAGETTKPNTVGREVTAELMLDQTMIFIVENRIQLDGRRGLWLAAAMHDAKGNRLFAALGFTADRKVADRVQYELATGMQAQAFMPVSGILGGTEPPLDQMRGRVVQSLSLAQLVNAWGAKAEPTYPAFLILSEKHTYGGLEPITMRQITNSEINWLNIFYGIEWAVFAGFALFLWWRLVRDAQLREIDEAASAPAKATTPSKRGKSLR